MLKTIIAVLEDRKAQDIVYIDLRENEEALIDYMVVCEGNSNTQVAALSNNLNRDVYERIKVFPFRMEYTSNDVWTILDYFEIVVHIFQRETRQFYQLEDLWSDSPIYAIEH
ncbi:MAG: ribosome silencing factor [Chitinophagales bacterium]|jgi:ribosome-associated protein|nr:ribosome silencing factor [Chitinophagales bacterium]